MVCLDSNLLDLGEMQDRVSARNCLDCGLKSASQSLLDLNRVAWQTSPFYLWIRRHALACVKRLLGIILSDMPFDIQLCASSVTNVLAVIDLDVIFTRKTME
jgi:hypothetical protein